MVSKLGLGLQNTYIMSNVGNDLKAHGAGFKADDADSNVLVS